MKIPKNVTKKKAEEYFVKHGLKKVVLELLKTLHKCDNLGTNKI